MDYYLLAFMIIILVGSVVVYLLYLKEKREHLESIKRGICPKCKQNTIELSDHRSGGCSAPSMLSFECISCGYTNSFSIQNDNRWCR